MQAAQCGCSGGAASVPCRDRCSTVATHVKCCCSAGLGTLHCAVMLGIPLHFFIKLLLCLLALLLAAGEKALQLPLLAKEVFKCQVHTSAKTKKGLSDLDAALLQLAGAPQLAAGGVSWSVNERQAEALIRAHEALMSVGDSIAADVPLDCWTIDLRAALIALGEVGGEGVSEEVLGSVFSKFCIGK